MPLEIRDKSLYNSVVKHLKNTAQASKLVKGFLLFGGALVAGVAQFMDIDATGLKANQVFGIVGSLAVFLVVLA